MFTWWLEILQVHVSSIKELDQHMPFVCYVILICVCTLIRWEERKQAECCVCGWQMNWVQAIQDGRTCFMVCSGLLWVFMDCILHKKCDYDFWRPNLKKLVCGWLAYDKKPVSLLENTKSMQKWQRNDNKRQTVALQIQNKPVSAFESLFCIIHDFILCYPPWSGASIGVWMTLEASWNVSGELCIIGFRSYAL